MDPHRPRPHRATVLTSVIGLLATGGVLGGLTGLYPGLVLLLAAVILAVAQRSTLARAIRTPDSNRRRRRLVIAAVLALIFLGSIVSFARAVRDDHISTGSLLIHNVIGVPAMIGAAVFLVVGLFTPRNAGTVPVRPHTRRRPARSRELTRRAGRAARSRHGARQSRAVSGVPEVQAV